MNRLEKLILALTVLCGMILVTLVIIYQQQKTSALSAAIDSEKERCYMEMGVWQDPPVSACRKNGTIAWFSDYNFR